LAGTEPHFIKEIWGEPWSTSIYNNIFASYLPNGKIDMRKNKNTVIDNNLYYNAPTIVDKNGSITDANKITANPGFLNMQGQKPEDFQLAPDSPAIGKGRIIPNNGGRDFFDNPVSDTNAPNIGADNGKSVTSNSPIDLKNEEMFSIYPNISDSTIYLKISESVKKRRVKIHTLNGHLVEEIDFNHFASSAIEFDISSYRNGMYIVSLDTGNKKHVKRFIKL